MGTSRNNKIALAAALTATLPIAALAQGLGNPGGWQLDLGVSSSLKSDDNFKLQVNSAGSSTIFDNKFTFGLSSVTATESFALTGSTVLRYADIPGRSTSGFEDPTIKLDYSRSAANSRMSMFLRYRHVDREFLDPFQVEQEEQQYGLLTDDGGTLTQRGAGLTLQTGLNSPLGFSLALKHDDKAYANVTNPQLFDNRTSTADATVSMKVSPVTQLKLNYGLKDYNADEPGIQTHRVTTDYSVGVVQDIDQTLVLDARIGVTDVQTDTLLGSTGRSGTTGAVTLTKSLPNGSMFATVDTTLNQNGTRSSFRFGRDLTLPSGKLSGSLGLTRTPGGKSNSIAALSYSLALKDSDVTVSLNRAVSTNSVNQDVLDTRINVTYGRNIDSLSRIGVTVNWGRSEGAGGTAIATVDRATLRATYSRSLTQDWDMTGGVELRRRTDSSVANDAQSNAIFLTLDRKFSFRP
ncbi:MAG: hypothetical protein KDE03_11960 [Rhodobacteraceae bacterium]|nr:hypothetical protein [Paracoccaceae bacterium]